ncbi:MAG: hypothetical protein KAT62_00645 [Desulfuromonadales bacterium]|nr:hypothetical protein [Desulfuromonadales bacterium]
MKVAKASKKDFDKVWAIYRAIGLLDSNHFHFGLRKERCKNLLIGRVGQLGQGGLMRVAMGCDMLIDHCCDPGKDHYSFSPELLESMHPYDSESGE